MFIVLPSLVLGTNFNLLFENIPIGGGFSCQNRSPFLASRNWYAMIQPKVCPTVPPLTEFSAVPPANKSTSSTLL